MKNIDLKNIDVNLLKDNCSKIIEKMKLDKPFQKKVVVFFAIIILIIVGTSLINSYQKDIIKEVNSKQTEYQEIESFLTKYNNNASSYKSDINKVHAKILEEQDIDKANVVILKLAENNTLTIQNNKKNDKKDNAGNNIFAQAFEISVSGSYSNVIKFVNDIENSSFFVSVEGFDVGKAGDPKTAENVTVKITYKIFYQK